MTSSAFHFEDFRLDLAARQLTRGGAAVDLNSRYLDALALLVREQGKLVSKDAFLEEVWRGVPVTDEALTQCIRTLRKQLGDDAGSPRFIETVPKHGYRFIAAVEQGESSAPRAATASSYSWRQVFLLGGAGAAGGALAGVLVGLLYGFAGALQSSAGALSALLVLVAVAVLAGVIGAAGIGFGIAAAGFARGARLHWSILGGGAGGLLMGAFVKLLGLDAFTLLFGHSPGEITGAAEGAILGGALGLGMWLGGRAGGSLIRRAAPAAVAGAAAGVLIPLLGGRMLGGSLDLLDRGFPNSRLQLDQIGALLGERGFGPLSQAVTGGIEGMIFGASVVAAMILVRARWGA